MSKPLFFITAGQHKEGGPAIALLISPESIITDVNGAVSPGIVMTLDQARELASALLAHAAMLQ